MRKLLVKTFFALIPILPLYLFGDYVLSNNAKLTGFISYYYLVIALSITPISYFLLKTRFKKFSNFLISIRRPIGITTGVIAILHMLDFGNKAYGIWQKFFSSELSFGAFLYDSIFNNSGDVLGMSNLSFWSGLVGFVIMMFLLFSSNNISQKILGAKFWKYLQRLIYPLFILVVIHIYFVGGWKGLYLYPALIVIILRSLTWFTKNFTYKGRHHISKSGYRRFLCPPCGYIYDEELGDPDGGLAPGTKYEDIPDDWICPICGAAKKDFIPLDGDYKTEDKERHKIEFVIDSLKYLTDDVIELKLLSSKELHILPGQFFNLLFKNEKGERESRSYSVAEYLDNRVTFLIKLKEGGLAGKYFSSVKTGEKIKAIGPFGDFVLQNTSNKKIFIATGTGLSPVYNMIKNSWNLEKELYFGVQKKKDLFYLKELEVIPNLKINIYLSREDIKGFNFGRIDLKKIKYKQDTEIYMCGSPGLIDSFKTEINKSGHKKLFIEKFL